MTESLADTIARAATDFRPDHERLVVAILVAVAHADLDIDATEREGIRIGVNTALETDLDAASLDEQITDARRRIAVAGGVRFADQVGKNVAAAGMPEAGVRLAYAIAAISEGISADEQLRLDALARGTGLPANRIAAIRAEFSLP